MPYVTIAYGLILVVLGVGGYFGSGMASWTALIPALFGLPVLIAGILAIQERFLKHAMHAAAAIGLLGALGSARGLPGLLEMAMGAEVERPQAVVAQAIMCVLSVGFVALCVWSFISVRRARKAAEGQQPAGESS